MHGQEARRVKLFTKLYIIYIILFGFKFRRSNSDVCKLDAIQLTCMPYGGCLGPYKMSLKLFEHAREAEFE